ncbi:MAG: acetyl-CoA carboxylase biotin carboxyl carrier protein [Candidatus Latescibacteria bacterium]|nr:acetyl-CoA carboxylase biotin carboxyl carrier protein [Candidatus Latescibacterota bacterium]
MDLNKVRELVKLVEESRIDELEVIDKDTTIRIQKHATPSTHVAYATTLPAAPAVAPAAAPLPAAAPAGSAAPATNPERAKWREIRSPIVGTLYRASSPDVPNFVNTGDVIKQGQTLCIIEAMKVMNEIEAEFGGVIKEILVENATPVEAEAILFLVDPA